MHEQESELTLKGHMEAIEYFLKMKQKGVIKSFGISTHHISGVKAAATKDYIDVIHPILNQTGVGIVDGTSEEMLSQINRAHRLGKGIYTMKPLGGGHLIKSKDDAFDYALSIKSADSIAIGIGSDDELNYNVKRFLNLSIDPALKQRLIRKDRKLFIHDDWCVKCKKCIDRCNLNALSFEDNKIKIDHEKCVTCSYCSTACSEMAIKII